MTRGIQRRFHCTHSSPETLIQSGFTGITLARRLKAGSVASWNDLRNCLSNYTRSCRNSAGRTGVALGRSDFRLLPVADNDSCVSFHLLSSTASGLVINLNRGYAGFAEAWRKRQLSCL